ncbi:hypothetical protein HW555_000260, partial [Spodoptera exigua]
PCTKCCTCPSYLVVEQDGVASAWSVWRGAAARHQTPTLTTPAANPHRSAHPDARPINKLSKIILNLLLIEKHHRKTALVKSSKMFKVKVTSNLPLFPFQRAAYESVGRLQIRPHNFLEKIDIRTALLPSVPLADDGYNPLDHRKPEAPIKPWMAYFNIIRTLFGPGVLIMPLAISQAGIILGPILGLCYGLLLVHTHIMLLNSLNEIARQLKIPYVSYRYGFRLAVLHGPPLFQCIGKHGPQIIAIFMFMSQLGICTIYVILTSDSLRDLMDWQSNNTALLALLPPYLLLEFCMKTLSIVSYISLTGTMLNLLGLSLVVYQTLSDPAKVYKYAANELMPILIACGAFLCNLSAVGVILTLDKNLENPRLMTSRFGVIRVGMTLATVCSMIIGSLGYWSFGTMEENVLRVLPLDEVTALMILSLYLVSVSFAYPIQCYPAIAVIIEVIKYHDPMAVPDNKMLKRLEIFGRPLFVLLTFMICYFVPFQAPFVAFTGNLCTTMMSVIFPALMDTCLKYPDRYGYKNFYLIKNLLLIALGLFCWTVGAYLCGYIIHSSLAAFEQVSRMTVRPYQTDRTIDIRRTRLPSTMPEDDDYDPKEHRSPTHNIKLWMAYFNLLRSMCAAGMLAMPLVISKGGIVVGPILTILTGLLVNYVHHLLLSCLNEIARQLRIPYISYRYGFRLALLHGPPAFHSIGRHGPTIIAVFMVASQLGICTVFVIFTGDCLRDIMDWQSSQPAFMCLIFPYFVLEFFMKDLSIVSYVAMFGNFLNLMGIICVFGHILADRSGEPVSTHTDISSILFCFGSLLFNLSAVGVTLSIDKSLKQAKKMTSKYGVLNVGILIPTLISAIFGIMGYFSFGSMDENILRALPYDDITSMAAIGFYLVAVGFAYPLQCYPAIATIIEVIKYHDDMTTPSDETLRMIETIARPIFVVMSSPFVAFVGNLCTSMLALICPALMDLCIRYPYHYGRNNFHLYKDLFILFLGFTTMIFGVIFCVHLIRIRVLASSSPNNYGFL